MESPIPSNIYISYTQHPPLIHYGKFAYSPVVHSYLIYELVLYQYFA